MLTNNRLLLASCHVKHVYYVYRIFRDYQIAPSFFWRNSSVLQREIEID
jgi:hypothetical protein